MSDNPKMKLDDVIRLGEDQYLTCISAQKLVDLWQKCIVTYNGEIQRGTKLVINSEKEEIEAPVYSAANVKKIKTSILGNNYETDMLTFNILKDGSEKIEYKEKTLTVYVGEINVCDGQHRLRSLDDIVTSAAEECKNFDLSKLIFPVKITHYDIPHAQHQFHQFSQGLKISSSRAEYFNQNGLSNKIVRSLMEGSLNHKIEVVKNNIPKKDTNKLVSFATMVNAIDTVYKPATGQEADKIAKFLDEYFLMLIDLVPELADYETRLESKKISLYGENIMFYGYIAISQLLYDDVDWIDKINLILNLDLAKDSNLWFGKVTKSSANGKSYSIINSADSRATFINEITKQFKVLLDRQKVSEGITEKEKSE